MRQAAKLVTLALAGSVLAAHAARAEGDVAEMLRRARLGLPAGARDRELAADLLEQWRESERVASEPGDQALGRALQSISAGRRAASDERAAMERYESASRRSRLAEGAWRVTASDGAPTGPGSPSPSRAAPHGRASALWIVAGLGAAVVVGGSAWILITSRLSRR